MNKSFLLCNIKKRHLVFINDYLPSPLLSVVFGFYERFKLCDFFRITTAFHEELRCDRAEQHRRKTAGAPDAGKERDGHGLPFENR